MEQNFGRLIKRWKEIINKILWNDRIKGWKSERKFDAKKEVLKPNICAKLFQFKRFSKMQKSRGTTEREKRKTSNQALQLDSIFEN